MENQFIDLIHYIPLAESNSAYSGFRSDRVTRQAQVPALPLFSLLPTNIYCPPTLPPGSASAEPTEVLLLRMDSPAQHQTNQQTDTRPFRKHCAAGWRACWTQRGECSPAGEGQQERGGRLKVNLGPGSLGFPHKEIGVCVGS